MKSIQNVWVIMLLLIAGCSGSDDDPTPPGNIDKTANLLATGASANDILDDASFNILLIEVAYVQNNRPTQEAMDNFVAFLSERSFKDDILLRYNALPSPGEEDLSLQEVADLEDANRTAYNTGDTLAIYIYFADAPSVNDDEGTGEVTLGAVYRNTSMIIYEQTVKKLAAQSALITVADVETTTLNHEFGHLFGLVDLGTAEINPHEDPDAANHCNVQGCLMRAELQFGGGLMTILENRASKGLAVPSLDAECILDLQANGGK